MELIAFYIVQHVGEFVKFGGSPFLIEVKEGDGEYGRNHLQGRDALQAAVSDMGLVHGDDGPQARPIDARTVRQGVDGIVILAGALEAGGPARQDL